MNDVHPAFAAALAPFAPPDAFTEAQLLEADRHLAGPARDPQFFDRKTELYEQRSQQEAERLLFLNSSLIFGRSIVKKIKYKMIKKGSAINISDVGFFCHEKITNTTDNNPV